MKLQEEVKILIDALSGAGQRPVHLGQMVNVCATNALARTMLGRRVVGHELGSTDKKAEEFRALVLELMVLSGVFSLGEYVPPLEVLDLQGLARKMRKLRESFFAFLSSIIETHEIDDSREMDILSTLISLKDVGDDQGESITDAEIKALLLVSIYLFVFNFSRFFIPQKYFILYSTVGLLTYRGSKLLYMYTVKHTVNPKSYSLMKYFSGTKTY